MNYSDATKKRNVTSWNKLIPLNIETLINRVENLDQSHQTIGNYFLIKDFSYVYNKLLN
jgi:hypothetical protein